MKRSTDERNTRAGVAGEWSSFFFTARRTPKIAPGNQIPFPISVTKEGAWLIAPDFSALSHKDSFFDLLSILTKQDRQLQLVSANTLRQAGVMKHIVAMTNSRPKEAFPPDFFDLMLLYMAVRKKRPSMVLELGSGISTLVIALAIAENRCGSLLSLEPDANWAEETLKALPARLRESTRIACPPPTPCSVGGIASVAFDYPSLEQQPPDFIYVDGCHEGAVFLGAENVALIEPHLPVGTVILIDARLHAVEYFMDERFHRRKYEVFRQGLLFEGKEFRYGWLDQFSNALAVLVE